MTPLCSFLRLPLGSIFVNLFLFFSLSYILIVRKTEAEATTFSLFLPLNGYKLIWENITVCSTECIGRLVNYFWSAYLYKCGNAWNMMKANLKSLPTFTGAYPKRMHTYSKKKGVPSAESSRSVQGLGKSVSGKPYPRLCNARRPRLEPGTFRSQARSAGEGYGN
ncbi:uncharacterized protein [Miscanthus floridulus]|uniref:uncharacterized protein isoform X1 n=1 Tax=Miscanthus floridulus TaxID=154761 RepID=UPI00345751D8